MGYEDNKISVPECLPEYVAGFADRFPVEHRGPIEQYQVSARLATGHGLTVFSSHVEETGDHFLLPFGSEDSDPGEVQRLEAVVDGLAGPRASEVARVFRRHVDATYDQVVTVEGIVFLLECQYAPAIGGRPTLVLQAYANPASESLSVGYTARSTDDPADLETCIAKNVSKDTLEDYVDQVLYRVDTAIYEERIALRELEEVDRQTLDAHGFREQTVKPVPRSLHPKYGGTDAELWQLPASKASWADGATGFVRIWRLPDGTGIIEPLNLTGDDRAEIEATKEHLSAKLIA